MERSKNLEIKLGDSRVIKSSSANSIRLERRLQREHAALILAQAHLPNRVPEVFSFSSDGAASQITMERLGSASRVSFDSIAELVEDLQTLPIHSGIPVYNPPDYLRNAEIKLRFLLRRGCIVGLGENEVEKIRRVYYAFLPHLGPFRTVFVHGDIQTRHFATKENRLAIVDFDQAHFGSELEDWAFLSIRHPSFSVEITSYLRDKFGTSPERSINLGSAFLLTQIDKILHGYFSRTYQWRGKPFDVGAKVYGRGALRLFLRKATQVMSGKD